MLQNDEGKLFKVNGQHLKVFFDAQLPEEELDIVNYMNLKLLKERKMIPC
jgi:hypothetical protein